MIIILRLQLLYLYVCVCVLQLTLQSKQEYIVPSIRSTLSAVPLKQFCGFNHMHEMK